MALCWKWWQGLFKRGKDPRRFVAALVGFATKAVRCGRRVTGQLNAKDVMNEQAQQRHGFCVGKLPDFATLSENPLAEALIDNTQTEVPDQVAFRIDFPAWRSRSRRDRRLIDDMAMGERTLDLSRKHRLSPARISQLRRELHDSWEKATSRIDVRHLGLKDQAQVPCSLLEAVRLGLHQPGRHASVTRSTGNQAASRLESTMGRIFAFLPNFFKGSI